MWGELTDRADLALDKKEETSAVEETMRRAAREWLDVSDDEPQWRLYFDHWLYEEMGYERPSG